MRKILINAKSITPKKIWKKGFAVIDLRLALNCKRPPFKFIDKEREGDLKAILASKVAQGNAYVIINRKARLTGDDFGHTYGIVGELSDINAEAFPNLTNEERLNRVKGAMRFAYSNNPLIHIKEMESNNFFKVVESTMKRDTSKRSMKVLKKILTDTPVS